MYKRWDNAVPLCKVCDRHSGASWAQRRSASWRPALMREWMLGGNGQARLQGGVILEERPKQCMEVSKQRGQRAFCHRGDNSKGKD